MREPGGWIRKHWYVSVPLLVVGLDAAVVLAAVLLPVHGGGCAQALQFAGNTKAYPAALALLRSKCAGVDTDAMLLLDFVFLAVYGTALAVVCLLGAYALYRGRMRIVARWAGRAAIAAAVADAVENGLLLAVPEAIRTGAEAGDPITLWAAQGFALVKWVAVLPAVLVAALVTLTVLARLVMALRRADDSWGVDDPEAAAGPQVETTGPRKPTSALWSRNYWLPRRHLPDHDGPRLGICLSGGGIRSGTFALGALQVFAERGLLAKADYLAAVSGGGYTGGAHQLLRARAELEGGGNGLPPAPLEEAFEAGSPEESYLRRHGKYIADGAAQWIRAVLTVLRNVLVNLALIYGVLFVVARPLGAAYVSARPWSNNLFFVGKEPDCGPDVKTFPCVWDWPNFPRGTWVAFLVPFLLAFVVWVAAGLPSEPEPSEPDQPTPRSWRRWLLDRAGGMAVLGIAVAMVVVGGPILVRVFQWLAAHSGDTGPPELAVIVSLVTAATAIWNMLAGKQGAATADRPSILQRIVSGLGFATRMLVSFAVVAVLLLLVLIVFASHLSKAVADYAARPKVWEGPLADWRWGVVAAAILLLGTFFDQTRLSLHPFYKRRLSSAFAVQRTSRTKAEEIPYSIGTTLSDYGRPAPGGKGPKLVLCAAANVSGQQVAPPGRRATSFVFAHDLIGGPALGYLRTKELEGLLRRKPYRSDITLVAAMAISGAAFASSMGKMSGPFNILLSLTNARLGVWLPNPRYLARRRESIKPKTEEATEKQPWMEPWRPLLPRLRRLTYLAKEIFGIYSPDDRLVYVTDGGHYENLGLVELLRRRCKTVYCIDASGDTSLAHTLAEAAALAYEELGVQITIEGIPLAPQSATEGTATNLDLRALERRLAAKPVVEGCMQYPPDEYGTELRGRLVVGKSVLTADLPYPLRAHAVRALRFPSESTADQWFDADQFNAYLMLGRHVAERMCEPPAWKTPVAHARRWLRLHL